MFELRWAVGALQLRFSEKKVFDGAPRRRQRCEPLRAGAVLDDEAGDRGSDAPRLSAELTTSHAFSRRCASYRESGLRRCSRRAETVGRSANPILKRSSSTEPRATTSAL